MSLMISLDYWLRWHARDWADEGGEGGGGEAQHPRSVDV